MKPSETTDEPRVVLTVQQALDMVRPGELVHTFRSVPGTLIGADWDRSDIEKAIRENRCELAGPIARSTQHSLAVMDPHGPLFVATKEDAN